MLNVVDRGPGVRICDNFSGGLRLQRFPVGAVRSQSVIRPIRALMCGFILDRAGGNRIPRCPERRVGLGKQTERPFAGANWGDAPKSKAVRTLRHKLLMTKCATIAKKLRASGRPVIGGVS